MCHCNTRAGAGQAWYANVHQNTTHLQFVLLLFGEFSLVLCHVLLSTVELLHEGFSRQHVIVTGSLWFDRFQAGNVGMAVAA